MDKEVVERHNNLKYTHYASQYIGQKQIKSRLYSQTQKYDIHLLKKNKQVLNAQVDKNDP